MKGLLSLALLLVVLSIAPARPWNHFDPLAIEGKGYPGQIPLPLAPGHYTQPSPKLAKTSSFLPLAWNHFDPLAIEGKEYPRQIPLPLAPARPWNLPRQIALPLVVSVQTHGNQVLGIWMCKDKNGDTVFSNRTEEYRECRPYVVSPGLREAFLKEMLLKRKQHAPQHVIPDQSSTKSTVIGPL
jgi:hypothetical protein